MIFHTVLCRQRRSRAELPSRHGLVVGVEIYRDSRLNLRCAGPMRTGHSRTDDRPASAGMFPQENVRLLLDAEATKENVWRALSSLAARGWSTTRCGSIMPGTPLARGPPGLLADP